MSFALAVVLSSTLLPVAEAEKPSSLRYLHPALDKYVLEGEVVSTRSEDGTVLTWAFGGPGEKLTLTEHRDRDGNPKRAEVVQERPRKVATLTFGEKGAGTLKRGGITDFLKDLPARPLVTAGPEWTAALQLLPLYDSTRGGKQKVPGLWIDPVQGLQTHTFAVERQAAETVTVKDKLLKVVRYRMKLRVAEAAAWADGTGAYSASNPWLNVRSRWCSKASRTRRRG